MSLEIEKKFILKPLNIEKFLKKNSLKFKSFEIDQYYILNEQLIRIRKFGDRYFLTVKKGEGLVREEFEKEIKKDEFYDILKKSKEFFYLYKTRYQIKVDDKIYEIDRFKKELNGLFFLEIEFKSKNEAQKYKIDDIFKKIILKEVTEDSRFANFSLAKTKEIPSLEKCENILNIDEITPLCSTQDALKTILHSLFRVAKHYEEKILENDKDIENLHQFRVSLRKMRVLLKEFREFFEDKWYEEKYQKIKNIMNPTNKKRDLDVLLDNFDDYLSHLPPSMKESLYELKDELKKLQKEEEKKVFNLLKNSPLKELYKDLEDIKFSKKAEFPIIITSYNTIKKREKKIYKLAKSIDKNSPASKYHQLRIQFKRLRYLLEFFTHFYEKKEIEKLIKNIKNIQDILGRHQDLEVQRLHIKEYLKDANLSFDTILSTGKLLGDMEFEEIYLRKIFRKRYKKLLKKIKESYLF